jgi:hypothetical protein
MGKFPVANVLLLQAFTVEVLNPRGNDSRVNDYPECANIFVNNESLPDLRGSQFVATEWKDRKERVNTTYYAADGRKINGTLGWKIRPFCPPVSVTAKDKTCRSPIQLLRYTIITRLNDKAFGFDVAFRNDGEKPEIVGLGMTQISGVISVFNAPEDEATLRGNLNSWVTLRDT